MKHRKAIINIFIMLVLLLPILAEAGDFTERGTLKVGVTSFVFGLAIIGAWIDCQISWSKLVAIFCWLAACVPAGVIILFDAPVTEPISLAVWIMVMCLIGGGWWCRE